jgi:hypothetical protein
LAHDFQTTKLPESKMLSKIVTFNPLPAAKMIEGCIEACRYDPTNRVGHILDADISAP